MSRHQKPTKEELLANIEKADEELKNLKPDDEEKKEDEELEEEDSQEEEDQENQNDDSNDDDSEDSDDESDDKSGDDSEDDDSEEDSEEDEKDSEDDSEKDDDSEDDDKSEKKELSQEQKDKKLKASTQESQILYARNQQMQEAITEAASIPDPDDEAMKKIYSNWEEMTEFEQKLAREGEGNKLRMAAITGVKAKFEELDQWKEKVDEFVDDPATIANNPDLDGREDEFRIFATKPTRRGVSFDVLVGAFLHEVDQEVKSRPKKKGKMFPQGKAGQKREKPKKTKLSATEAGRLRKTNYKKYTELLRAGKIDPSDLS